MKDILELIDKTHEVQRYGLLNEYMPRGTELFVRHNGDGVDSANDTYFPSGVAYYAGHEHRLNSSGLHWVYSPEHDECWPLWEFEFTKSEE